MHLSRQPKVFTRTHSYYDERMRPTQTPDEFGFVPRDSDRLRSALSQIQDVRHYRRVQAVLLVAQGYAPVEVVRMTDSWRWALYSWIRRFVRRHDPQDLRDAPRTGRPHVALELTDEVLLQEFAQDPMDLGYSITHWTVPMLATHLNNIGYPLSQRTLRRRLQQLGLRWKRPRYTFSEKDPQKGPKKGG